MAVVGELLFFRRDQVDLDAVLRHQGDAAVQLVDQLPESAFIKHTDDELVAQVAAKARIAPLALALDAAKADVEETTVDVDSVFGERLRVKGLRATKTIPFTGDADLWHLRTNPYDFNPPHGEVQGKNIVVGVEVPEQQSDQAVIHIDDTIRKINEWLQRQDIQLKAFNGSLPTRILPLVQQRRARLGKAADLLKKLQG
jgi:hypothetical protein